MYIIILWRMIKIIVKTCVWILLYLSLVSYCVLFCLVWLRYLIWLHNFIWYWFRVSYIELSVACLFCLCSHILMPASKNAIQQKWFKHIKQLMSELLFFPSNWRWSTVAVDQRRLSLNFKFLENFQWKRIDYYLKCSLLSLVSCNILVFVSTTRKSKFIQFIHYLFFILIIFFCTKSTKSDHITYINARGLNI